MEDLIKKYQRTKLLIKRRSLLSAIVNAFGRDKAAAVCKLEDADWLHWYYWEIPSKAAKESKDGLTGKKVEGEA